MRLFLHFWNRDKPHFGFHKPKIYGHWTFFNSGGHMRSMEGVNRNLQLIILHFNFWLGSTNTTYSLAQYNFFGYHQQSKRIALLPSIFAHSRPTWVNSRWKIHMRELTHIENTLSWINSGSAIWWKWAKTDGRRAISVI